MKQYYPSAVDRYLWVALRAVVRFGATAALINLCKFCFLDISNEILSDARSTAIWCAALTVVFTMLSAVLFCDSDDAECAIFLQSIDAKRKKDLAYLLRMSLQSPFFWLDAGIQLFLSLFYWIPNGFGGFYGVDTLFSAVFSLKTTLSRLLGGALMTVLLFVTTLFAYVYVRYNVRPKKQVRIFKAHLTDSKAPRESRRHPFLQILKTVLILLLWAPFFGVGASILAIFVPSIDDAQRSGSPILLFFWFVVIVFAIMLLRWVPGSVRAITKRRKFLRSLRRMVEENRHIEISEIRYPYLSIWKQFDGPSFTLYAHGKKYPCRLLSGRGATISMVFSESGGEGKHRHTFYLRKVELFSLDSAFSYAFDADGYKCLIVTGVPKKCFVGSSNGHMTLTDTGARFGDYKFFTPTGFLNAVERNCVER